MSNFKAYLAKVRNEKEISLETSNFLNENFSNYIKNVFYEKNADEEKREIKANNKIIRKNIEILTEKNYIELIIYPKQEILNVSLKTENELIKKTKGEYSRDLNINLLKGASKFEINNTKYENKTYKDFIEKIQDEVYDVSGPSGENTIKVTVNNVIINNILKIYFENVFKGIKIIDNELQSVIISNKVTELKITKAIPFVDGTIKDVNAANGSDEHKINSIEIFVETNLEI
jgi:hypothetical protein